MSNYKPTYNLNSKITVKELANKIVRIGSNIAGSWKVVNNE